MKKQILFSLIFLLSFIASKASHYMGGQVTYKWISGNNYRVKLTIYRDCAGIPLGTTASILISNGTNGLNVSLTRVSSRDVTLLCPNQTSLCNGNGSAFGVEEHIYEDVISFPQINGVYTISFSSCCRNAAITTLISPGSQQLFLSATLDPNLSIKNTSPDLLNIPIANFAPNQFATLSPNGFDADGDALKYSLVSAKDISETDPVNYAAGFSATNPLTSSTPITINPNTGIISFTPSVSNQIAVIAIRVEEYRNGVKIGEMTRDIQIRVFNISNNYPSISQVHTVVVPVGQPFCTSITATDANNDSIDLSLIGLVPNSNFTITTDGIGNAAGNFCFTPTAADAGRTFTFTVNAIDNHCPVILASSMTFNVIVPKPCSSLGLSSTITNASSCGTSNGAISLSVASGVQPFSYYWSGNNGFTATTQSITNVSSGSYRVIVVDGNNCTNVLNVNVINTNDTIVIDTTILSDCKKIKFRDITYSSNATVIDTFKSVSGCDSAIHYFMLNVVKPVSNLITKVSCTGEKIMYNGKTYGVSTKFIDTIRTAKGCDSIYNEVTIIIKKVVPVTQVLNLVSCNGKLTFNGITYNSPVTLVDTIRTKEGCDSIYKQTNINISSIKVQLQNITINGCQSVLYKTNLYTANTILKDTIKSIYGCDSIYLNVTINVAQALKPSVSILFRGNDRVCKGSNISVKAFPVNDGTNPQYQWTVNGVPVAGATGVYFISNSLNNGDTIRCILTSNYPCVTSNDVVSNYVIARIATPTFKQINVSGCNSATVNNITYQNSTTVFDTVRNNIGCDSIITTINITINKVNAETVTNNIVGCNNVIYKGVTYINSITLKDTLRSTNGCDSLYRINNIIVTKVVAVTNVVNLSGCGSVTVKDKKYETSVVLKDTIKSVLGCDSIYNITNINVTTPAIPTITISSTQNVVCLYVPIILTANITNGGNNPQYQWYKNGVLISGATSATLSQTYVGIINQTFTYSCVLVSNASCTSPLTAASNNLAITVGTNTSAAASISIAANQTTICSTATVLFTATTINGGSNPQYQWKKNGVNISGATTATYSATNIANNDVFTCALTSNSLCVSTTNVISNGIAIAVNASSVTDIYNDGSIIAPAYIPLYIPTTVSTTQPVGGTWRTLNRILVSNSTTNTVNITFTAISPGANSLIYQLTNQFTKCTTNYIKGVITISSAAPPATQNITMCSLSLTKTLTSNYSSTGTWTTSDPSVVSIVSTSTTSATSSVVIKPNTAGTATISYNVQISPAISYTELTNVTVAPVSIAPIVGSSIACVGATTQLSNATPNGVWSSIAGRATVNATGLVTGTSAGIAEIRYTVNNTTTNCSGYVAKTMTVNTMPSVPTIGYAPLTVNPQAGAGGGSNYCRYRTFDVTGNPLGGTWSSSNNSVMTISNLGTINTVGLGATTITYTITLNGCSNSRSVAANVVACANKGTKDVQQKNNDGLIVIYPNPARSVANFKIERLVNYGTIVITDLYGKKIKQQPLSTGTNTIDISTFSKGIYFINIIENESKITKKLIVD